MYGPYEGWVRRRGSIGVPRERPEEPRNKFTVEEVPRKDPVGQILKLRKRVGSKGHDTK